MKDLTALRGELDALDRQLVRLFEQRMDLAREIAAWKMARQVPVLDAAREEAVLASRAGMLNNDAREEAVRDLFREIMRLSRREQETMMKEAKNHA